MSEIKTSTHIRNEGFASLVKARCPGDTIRYVNSFDQGTAGYTAEKNISPDDDVVTRIKKKNELL